MVGGHRFKASDLLLRLRLHEETCRTWEEETLQNPRKTARTVINFPPFQPNVNLTF